MGLHLNVTLGLPKTLTVNSHIGYRSVAAHFRARRRRRKNASVFTYGPTSSGNTHKSAKVCCCWHKVFCADNQHCRQLDVCDKCVYSLISHSVCVLTGKPFIGLFHYCEVKMHPSDYSWPFNRSSNRDLEHGCAVFMPYLHACRACCSTTQQEKGMTKS